MENNVADLLLIAVGTLIFIVALSFSISLMSTVLKMSNAASEVVKVNSNSTIYESIGENSEKIISGSELYAYYIKYVINSASTTEKVRIYIRNNEGETATLLTLNTPLTKSQIDVKYVLKYPGTITIDGIEYQKFIFEKVG